MTEPIFANCVYFAWEPDVVEFRGYYKPGPAGIACVSLPGDVELVVDYADPSVFISMRMPNDSLEVRPIVAEILGESAADQISGTLAEGYRSMGCFVMDTYDGWGDVEPEVWPARFERGTRAGALVVLADRATDPDATPMERAMAVLDLASAGDLAAEFPAFTALVTDAQAQVPEVLAEHGDDLLRLARTDPAVADVVTASQYRELLPDEFYVRLDAPWQGPLPDMVLRTAREPRSRAARSADDGSRGWLLPPMANPNHDPRGRVPQVECVGGVWIVRVRGLGDSYWARVLDLEGSVLAAAPLRQEGAMLVAELVVPPYLAQSDVIVDITDTPFPPSCPTAFEPMMLAIRAGRQAVDLEHAGHFRLAAEHWTECCDRWDALENGTEERMEAPWSTDPYERWDALDDEIRTLLAMHNAEFAARRAEQRAAALGGRGLITDHLAAAARLV